MTIDASQNVALTGLLGLGASVANATQGVGIHICTADASATVNASNDELILEGNTNVGMSLLTDSDGVARITWGHGSGTDAYSGQIGYYHDGDYMNFLTGSTERMRVTSNGHLALGQTAATYRLEVINEHNGGWASRIINSGNSTPYVQWLRMSAASTTSTKFIQCTDNGGGDGNMKFIVFGDGDVESATNSYGAVSDVKLKQDVVDVRSYWDDFKAVRFRKFRFKTDVELDADAPSMYGVVAQELETVFPTLVTTHADTENRQVAVLDENGNPTYTTDENGNEVAVTEEKMVDLGTTTKSAKYSILNQIGLKVVQELQTRLEAAEAKIAALESA